MVGVILTLMPVVSMAICGLGLFSLFRVSRRRHPEPSVWPSVSILKPMAGTEDELVQNLETHVALDYPGEWELIVGVRSADDSAWAVATAFAQRHPGRVRAVLQEGEPGFNPKVNQLITLTRHAKYEVLAVTDANVRVPKNWLREHAAILSMPQVGLSNNIFSGEGEQTVGAAIDNMTLGSLCAASMAAGEVLFSLTQVVGKSFAIKRATLEAIGGWEEVKDLLAEDQRMGWRMVQAKYRARAASTFVANVQHHKGIEHFWSRHSRWAMLRFRVIPGYWLEPLMNPTFWALLALVAVPSRLTLELLGAAILFSVVFTDLCSRITRGHGFSLKWLLLIPFRDVLMLLAWARGATLRKITWRGNKLNVGKKTLLSRG